MNRAAISILGALTAALLAACGGGGNGGSAGSNTSAGIDGTGISTLVSVGSVTAFGSIVVNGVRFDTDDASFEIDGASGTQVDLSIGDVVVVRGSLDDDSTTTGVATEVIFDDVVEGPVAAGSIDRVAGTFVVLGQLVRVSGDTSFDDSIQPPSLDGLSDGDIVEISGFRASDGSIAATRIEDKPAGAQFELTGLVSGLDAGAFTFRIGDLDVDYSSASVDNFPGGSVTDGALVEVKGMALGGGGELLATRVEFKGNRIDGEDGDRVELEGFITRFVDADDFDVSGFPVTTMASTVFEGGVAADLGLDIKVEVEGDLNADGVLVATKVDIRRGNFVRVAALVDSVDPASGSFVVLGITVTTDELTRIEDKSDQDVSPFAVPDIMTGDYVEVRGGEFPVGSGEILAGLVERDDADGKAELRGFVTVENGSEIVILGVTISTSGATQYRDQNDLPIPASEFFSRVTVGSLVDVDGTEIGDRVIAAEELEIEVE